MHDLPLIVDALDFAAHAHRDQRRKGADATPYISHPIALARILTVEGGIQDPIVIAAALLHDTVEDCGVTLSELVQRFGQEVADTVAEVTDDKSLPKEKRKELQVEHAAHISDRAKLVKLADKIANVRDIGQNPPSDWSTERQHEYANWAAQVVYCMTGTHQLLESLFNAAHAAVVGETSATEQQAAAWIRGRKSCLATRDSLRQSGILASMKSKYFVVDCAPDNLQAEIKRQMTAAGEGDAW